MSLAAVDEVVNAGETGHSGDGLGRGGGEAWGRRRAPPRRSPVQRLKDFITKSTPTQYSNANRKIIMKPSWP